MKSTLLLSLILLCGAEDYPDKFPADLGVLSKGRYYPSREVSEWSPAGESDLKKMYDRCEMLRSQWRGKELWTEGKEKELCALLMVVSRENKAVSRLSGVLLDEFHRPSGCSTARIASQYSMTRYPIIFKDDILSEMKFIAEIKAKDGSVDALKGSDFYETHAAKIEGYGYALSLLKNDSQKNLNEDQKETVKKYFKGESNWFWVHISGQDLATVLVYLLGREEAALFLESDNQAHFVTIKNWIK
jgi:hypothetical protein